MKRMHVNLLVEDLDDSLRFYSALFGSEPTLVKPDYAQWILEDPSLNLSIVPAKSSTPGVGHLGIQVETPEELTAVRERVQTSRGPSVEEGDTICCYAASTKTWVEDPQGVSWETFLTSHRTEQFSSEGACASGDQGGGCC